VKTPKQVEVWPDLPRSRVGKVLKQEVRSRLLNQAGHEAPGPRPPG
jgi:fatty-acyl-CoA synthase